MTKLEEFNKQLERSTWDPVCKIDYHDGGHRCVKSCTSPFYDGNALREWMERVEPNDDRANIERLLEEVNPIRGIPNFVKNTKSTCALVFSILIKMGNSNLIYIFEHHKIMDEKLHDNLDVEDVTQLKRMLRENGVENPEEIVINFQRTMWDFTPKLLIMGMEGHLHIRNVLPFCERKFIDKGVSAEVFQVLVPKKFAVGVDEDIYKEVEDSKHHKCYKFAQKLYFERDFDVFQDEERVLTAVSGQPGVIQYFCTYRFKQENRGSIKPAILLELGEVNLENYFKRDPPGKPAEILKFWSSLLKVAEALKIFQKFQKFGDENGIYYRCVHGDVKPANILLVGEEFKLVDFGFSALQTLEDGTDRINMKIGRSSCGAPELPQDKKKPTSVSQNIDVWSFGCVLSIAVSWVVYGSQGVRDSKELRPSDTFHKNGKILPEITELHKQLRLGVRGGDSFTLDILDLIDKHLLREEKDRIGSVELYEKFSKIISPSGGSDSLLISKGKLKAVSDISGSERHRQEMQRGQVESSHPPLRGESPARSHQNETSESTSAKGSSRETRSSLQTSETSRDDFLLSQATSSQATSSRGIPLHSIALQSHLKLQDLLNPKDIWKTIGEQTYPMDLKICTAILRENPEVVKMPNETGLNPIMYAAKVNKTYIVSLLLPTSRILTKDKENKTLLHYAVMGCPDENKSEDFLNMIDEIIKIINKLPNPKSTINALDDNNKTALFYCVRRELVATAEKLIKNGASIKPLMPDGFDPLLHAISIKKQAMIRLFAEYDDLTRIPENEIPKSGEIKSLIRGLKEEERKRNVPPLSREEEPNVPPESNRTARKKSIWKRWKKS